MYRVTTYKDKTQSIVTIQEGVVVTVVDDAHEPVRVVDVKQLPDTRIGNIMADVEDQSKNGIIKTKEPRAYIPKRDT